MEVITVVSFPDLKRPEHYSQAFVNTEANMSGAMPPPIHNNVACIRPT